MIDKIMYIYVSGKDCDVNHFPLYNSATTVIPSYYDPSL